MSEVGKNPDRFHQVLSSELGQPLFLTAEEIEGGWREVLPSLARCLPAPYPIFDANENEIVCSGYPVLLSNGMQSLQRQMERLVGRELEFRLLDNPTATDRGHVTEARESYVRSLQKVFENVLLNDYGRGLTEIFLLFLSGEMRRTLASVPRLVRASSGAHLDGEGLRRQLAAAFGGLLLRAATAAADSVRKLADSPGTGETSPLLGILCQDPILLAEEYLPVADDQLEKLLPSRVHGDVGTLLRKSRVLVNGLGRLFRNRPELVGIVRNVCGAGFNPMVALGGLEPRLLSLVKGAGLAADLGLADEDVAQMRRLGLRLKALELVSALRQSVVMVEAGSAPSWVIRLHRRRIGIAESTRPLDFAAYGVVDSAVHRFGLIYDLTNFTGVLEQVRKTGRVAEEKALQFMYIFQSQTESIRKRWRLRFEKFLGDGAFFSARRAQRVLAAACEIQHAYNRLRESGFPFDKGLRIAVNYAEYRLLPMRGDGSGEAVYEFFGHGIVELARLTTGKSTRELEEFAEILIHAGYNPDHVDEFLAPLVAHRGKVGSGVKRPYSAILDVQGELVNEGIVLTVPFLQALDKELGTGPRWVGDYDGHRWLVLKLEALPSSSLPVGLRMLGVARLKGLAPMELVEVVRWPNSGMAPRSCESGSSLLEDMRRLAGPIGFAGSADGADTEEAEVPEDFIVVCFREPGGNKRWILGQYREGDDMVLHAVHVPLTMPEDDPETPVEMWLFQNRSDLSTMYQALLRESSGVASPMSSLRNQPEFRAWFLAAPHRSP
ncbi:MAG: hypothetical protein K8R59_12025 [Thermoanaerobaculales bacterium]|nr:hypothetical protein [Thermoanaerobaculales bacterium]